MNTTLSKTIRISLILAACLFVFSSCIRKKADYGKVVVKNIPVEKFHELEVPASVPVHIIQGKECCIKVKGPEGLLSFVNFHVVEGKLEALKKDMEGLLSYLAIYSATNSSHDGKQQEEYPAEQVLVSETVEKTEDSDIENEGKTMSFLTFVKKNIAYFCLLCLFVAIIIAFCFGRYVFPSVSSENENAKKEYGKPSQTYGISNRSEEPSGEKTNLSDNNLKKRGEYSSEYKDK